MSPADVSSSDIFSDVSDFSVVCSAVVGFVVSFGVVGGALPILPLGSPFGNFLHILSFSIFFGGNGCPL
jgi:hypothetical protein